MRRFTFAGRTCVITGAAGGIGAALALDLARRRASLVLVDRDAEGLDRVTGMARELGATEAHPYVCDLSDGGDRRDLADQVLGRHAGADLLINNAALMNRLSPVWEQDDREFTKLVDVNIRGVANVLRHFVPAMVKRKQGVIVNFSSGWGRSTSPEVAAYCASKWAIEGLTQSLAQELPGGMAAVALNPGIIDTEMLRSCFGESAAHYPTAEEWIRSAGPFLLRLSARDNGQSLTVPGAAT